MGVLARDSEGQEARRLRRATPLNGLVGGETKPWVHPRLYAR